MAIDKKGPEAQRKAGIFKAEEKRRRVEIRRHIEKSEKDPARHFARLELDDRLDAAIRRADALGARIAAWERQDAAGRVDARRDAEPYKRKFPSYTTAELKAFLKKTKETHPYDEPLTPERRKMIETEIEMRESGISKQFKTPQIGPVGRKDETKYIGPKDKREVDKLLGQRGKRPDAGTSPYSDGRAAGLGGATRASQKNPYKLGTHAYGEWRDGFDAGRSELKEENAANWDRIKR